MSDGIPTPAPVIAEMRDMRKAGYTVRAISNALRISYHCVLTYVRDIEVVENKPLTNRELDELLGRWR